MIDSENATALRQPPRAGRRASFGNLALDGGGIKAACASSFLAELEDMLGEPLLDYFDLPPHLPATAHTPLSSTTRALATRDP